MENSYAACVALLRVDNTLSLAAVARLKRAVERLRLSRRRNCFAGLHAISCTCQGNKCSLMSFLKALPPVLDPAGCSGQSCGVFGALPTEREEPLCRIANVAFC